MSTDHTKAQLDDFTLYVPIRDRRCCVPRVLKYYEDLPCRKLLVDSTRKPYGDPLTKSSHIKSFEYHWVGDSILYHQKLHLILNDLVDTPFVVDVADDDITLKKSIVDAVQWLRENGDYVLCDGEYAKLIDWKLVGRNPGQYYGMTTIKPHSNVPSERLLYTMKYFLSRNHAVMRTNVSRQIFKVFNDNYNLQAIKFIDRVFSAIASINGNFKTLPQLYQIKTDRGRITHKRRVRKELRFGVRPRDRLNDLLPISKILAAKESIDLEKAHIILKNIIGHALRTKTRHHTKHKYDKQYIPSFSGRKQRRQINEAIDTVKKYDLDDKEWPLWSI